MQQLLAIVRLTWKAAFRFRLFWVLALLLLGAVALLPLLIKDDGTARGFIQIMLTYTLSVITALLGFATLWVACGSLARDIEDCQMQMVVVKPIARWQIWLGKWLGLMALNALLLALAGACVYGLVLWRAQRLSPEQQTILRNEIFVARGTLRETPPDIEAATRRILQERLKQTPVPQAKVPEVEAKVREQVRAWEQVVPPNMLRRWNIELGWRKATLRDSPMFVRLKFHTADTNGTGTYRSIIEVGPPDSANRAVLPVKLAASTFHEFQIPPNLWDPNTGRLTIDFQNRDDVAVLFPLEDGMEVLYREGGFGLNFARGLGVVFCWLALLACVGLTASSFLSFPVAAFCSGSLLLVGMSTGTLVNAIEAGTIMGRNEETGAVEAHSVLDLVLIPFFKVLVNVFQMIQAVSPIDALSTGRSITWWDLSLAFLQIVVLLGTPIALIGIISFTRRELATAQGSS